MDSVTPTASPLGAVVARLRRLVGPRSMIPWSIATLFVQSGIIVTGATVRLTGSGLGCPTWPRCTDESYLPHPELGAHGVIEFGNRLLTFVLVAVAIGTFVAAVSAWRNGRRHGRTIRRLALAIALGVPLQAVIGGITVLTDLDPNIVSPHLLISVVLVGLSTWLLIRSIDPPATPVTRAQRVVVGFAVVAMAAAIFLGTLVTGAGPHSGDAGAHRNGLDIEFVARLHASAVWAVVAAAVILAVWVRNRASVVFVAVLFLQGLVGYLQYFNGLPIWLVVLHMVGVPVCTAAATWLLLSVRWRGTDAGTDEQLMMKEPTAGAGTS